MKNTILSKIRVEPRNDSNVVIVRDEKRVVTFEQLKNNEIFLW